MTDDNRPVTADVGAGSVASSTSGEDVESQTGSNQDASTSTDSLTKADVEQILGRRFETKAEAIKTLEGLKSLVGDQAEASGKGE